MVAVSHVGFSKTWLLTYASPWTDRRPKSKFKMAPYAILDFWKRDFWPMGRLMLSIFHLGTKFGAEILIDDQLMTKKRNSRWRPAAILDFQKPDFWLLAVDFPSGYQIWCRNVDQRPNYGQKSKFKMAAVRHLGIVASSYGTTHEVFSLGHISLSNFMLIRCIVLKILGFEFFAELAWNAYSHPQKVYFGGIWTPKLDWSSPRPTKGTSVPIFPSKMGDPISVKFCTNSAT